MKKNRSLGFSLSELLIVLVIASSVVLTLEQLWSAALSRYQLDEHVRTFYFREHLINHYFVNMREHAGDLACIATVDAPEIILSTQWKINHGVRVGSLNDLGISLSSSWKTRVLDNFPAMASWQVAEHFSGRVSAPDQLQLNIKENPNELSNLLVTDCTHTVILPPPFISGKTLSWTDAFFADFSTDVQVGEWVEKSLFLALNTQNLPALYFYQSNQRQPQELCAPIFAWHFTEIEKGWEIEVLLGEQATLLPTQKSILFHGEKIKIPDHYLTRKMKYEFLRH